MLKKTNRRAFLRSTGSAALGAVVLPTNHPVLCIGDEWQVEEHWQLGGYGSGTGIGAGS